jgi:hypothetical protein
LEKVVQTIVSVVVVLAIAVVLWTIFLGNPLDWVASYEGTVVDAYRDFNPAQAAGGAAADEYKQYEYYWRIETTDGEEKVVEVPVRRWGAVEQGRQVVKTFGTRWPRVIPDEEDEADAIPPPSPPETDEMPEPDAQAAPAP